MQAAVTNLAFASLVRANLVHFKSIQGGCP